MNTYLERRKVLLTDGTIQVIAGGPILMSAVATGLPGTQQDLLKVLRIDGEGHGEVHPGEGRDVIGG